jgi:ComF family protein
MEMPVLDGDVCRCCGDPLTAAAPLELCRACRLAPPAFERAVAYARYEDRMREAIHALKYEGMHPAARRMGAMLAQAVAKLADQAPRAMLVVPVPLHRSKHAQRGFNQARVLAGHALAALRRSHSEWRLELAPTTLMRIRATETQAGLSPRGRRMNVRGAFQVTDAETVRGRDVLLVDDILTTGATARAASLALKRAGAKSVWVATLARAGRVYPARAGNYDEQVEDGDEAPGTHDAPDSQEFRQEFRQEFKARTHSLDDSF